MKNNLQTFHPDAYYHVFSRTNNKEKLFVNDGNYLYFLRKYDQYISPVLTTYAYCLLGTHFHLLVKIKSEQQLQNFDSTKEKETKPDRSLRSVRFELDDNYYHKIVSRQFKNFFTSYSKAFNKQQSRSGNLFQRPFKRVHVKTEVHLANVTYYIHANPEIHGLVDNFTKYKWSSYHSFLSDGKTPIPRKEVFQWFGGKKVFVDFHIHKRELIDPFWIIE